ncbi:MAG TPA: peptide deformylase [bacterium]|nr:peptide deformylase [bacterium]
MTAWYPIPVVKDDDIKYCLRYLDDAVLREKSERVESLGTTEGELIKAMADVMVKHRGVGLAAPQVGVLKQIVVVHPSLLPEGADTLFINPEIVRTSDEEEVEEEGCLSLLSFASPLARPARAVVKYVDAKGRERELEAEGLGARVLVHEVDHLNGVLFIDHLSRLKRKQVRDHFRKLYRELGLGNR